MSESESPIESPVQEVRLMALPDVPQRYIPEEGDESKYVLVKYDTYMGVVRELMSAQVGTHSRLGTRLEEAVDSSAAEKLQAQFEASRQDAFEEGVASIKNAEQMALKVSEAAARFVQVEVRDNTYFIEAIEFPAPAVQDVPAEEESEESEEEDS